MTNTRTKNHSYVSSSANATHWHTILKCDKTKGVYLLSNDDIAARRIGNGSIICPTCNRPHDVPSTRPMFSRQMREEQHQHEHQ